MQHAYYMQQALLAAQSYKGFTDPNPAVGAVVVKNGEVVSVGAHQQAGLPHAEVMALRDISDASDAVLYVTLEPCCHHGKTPPCTDLIIAKNIKQVYFAYLDPNPEVAGNGCAQLLRAGVACEQLPIPEVDLFYREYAHWVKKQRPWVTAKIAVTADGFIAAAGGAPLAITGDQAQHYTHLRRKHSSALMTSAQTIINDDPAFNVRLGGEYIKKPLLVLDRQGRMPVDSQVLKSTGPVFRLHAKGLDNDSLTALSGVTHVAVATNASGLSLPAVFDSVGQLGFHHLWLEVGAHLLPALLRHNLVNELVVYVSAKTAALEHGLRLPKLLPATGKLAPVDSMQLGDDWVGIWLL